jgi:hypothetical protein
MTHDPIVPKSPGCRYPRPVKLWEQDSNLRDPLSESGRDTVNPPHIAEPNIRIARMTFSLPRRCSATELVGHVAQPDSVVPAEPTPLPTSVASPQIRTARNRSGALRAALRGRTGYLRITSAAHIQMCLGGGAELRCRAACQRLQGVGLSRQARQWQSTRPPARAVWLSGPRAGSGSRTHLSSLEGWRTAAMPCPLGGGRSDSCHIP